MDIGRKEFLKSVGIVILINMCMSATTIKDDGFYLGAKGNSAQLIKSHDGHKIFLGAKRKLNIQKSWLTSQNKENTKFRLSVIVPYDEDIGPSIYILMVVGKAYKQTGSGSSHNKTSSSIFFNISGTENAKQVSKYMNVPAEYRKHPRHNLYVTFIPTKVGFNIEEEVTATLRIVNVGANTVSFMQGGRNRAMRDNQYVFSAYHRGKQVEDIGTSGHMGGLSGLRILKSGEVFEDVISLSKWFSFDKTGIYEVHGSYYLDFTDSNAESWETIWEDYVSTDFIVKIKEENGTSQKTDLPNKK